MTPEVNVERLRMIEAIVARLASNSFLLKGWTVTLVAGLSAVSEANDNRSFAWMAVFVVGVFGTLDAYYLAMERKYRHLYELAAHDDAPGGPWNLSAGRVTAFDVLSALRSGPVWLLHGTALLVAVVVAAM